MIIITGAAGFVGSCLASRLNRDGYVDLVLVDDFSKEIKKRNSELGEVVILMAIDMKEVDKWKKENKVPPHAVEFLKSV